MKQGSPLRTSCAACCSPRSALQTTKECGTSNPSVFDQKIPPNARRAPRRTARAQGGTSCNLHLRALQASGIPTSCAARLSSDTSFRTRFRTVALYVPSNSSSSRPFHIINCPTSCAARSSSDTSFRSRFTWSKATMLWRASCVGSCRVQRAGFSAAASSANAFARTTMGAIRLSSTRSKTTGSNCSPGPLDTLKMPTCRWMMSLRVKGSSVSRSFQKRGLMFSSSTACGASVLGFLGFLGL